MTRRGLRIALLLLLLAVLVYAVVMGGFFWPRPQFRRGPWAPPDSLEAPAQPP